MGERVLNQAVYSLIKELEVWTDRREKGEGGVRCKCKCSAKCKCRMKCKCKAWGKVWVQAWGKCIQWDTYGWVFSVHLLFICMYGWYKYKGYGRCGCCSMSTIDCVISSKTNGVYKRGSWSGDGLWDNGGISCGFLIVWWDNACDLMSLPRPGHINPRRVMWGMKEAVEWGACVLHLRPMTRMIKCL